jgi:hypothetical protein
VGVCVGFSRTLEDLVRFWFVHFAGNHCSEIRNLKKWSFRIYYSLLRVFFVDFHFPHIWNKKYSGYVPRKSFFLRDFTSRTFIYVLTLKTSLDENSTDIDRNLCHAYRLNTIRPRELKFWLSESLGQLDVLHTQTFDIRNP